jgi:hypothetical protein
MGLTIHYQIKAPPGWSREAVKAKLEEARQFALGLPVLSVSEFVEFQGDQARREHGGGVGKVGKDPFYWAKAQATRTIARPQQPDTYAQQAPDRMVVFSVRPADGCEQMNVGTCDYPEYTWPADPGDGAEPAGRLARSKNEVTPPARGVWSSWCKTQYANDPRLGGWSNFLRAHLCVLAILEKLRDLGFQVTVDDEGGFWESRDLGKLAQAVRQYDSMVAGFTGAVRDAGEQQGMAVQSPMAGRPDFERLEMEGQAGLAEILQELKRNGWI